MSGSTLLAQTTATDTSGGVGVMWIIVLLVAVVLAIVGAWRTFEKAKQPGWAAIIPIYNVYIMLKIAGRPSWWLLLYLIPFINIIVSIMVSIDIAEAFGKSKAFGVIGLWLLGIGILVLGFGDAQYKGVPKH